MSGHRPPRLAEWLVRRASPPADAEFIVGDLREEFEHQLATLGAADARRWYWGDVARSFLPLLMRRLATPGPSPITPHPDPDRTMWMSFLGDARHGLRLARRTPLASFAVVATMVLGVGSTTTVFSAMNAILLQPLPFPESQRVVQLNAVVPNGQVIAFLAYPDVMDFRRAVPDFADVTVSLRRKSLQGFTSEKSDPI